MIIGHWCSGLPTAQSTYFHISRNNVRGMTGLGKLLKQGGLGCVVR